MSHTEAHGHDDHEEAHHGHDDHGHHDKDDHGHNGHEKEDHAHAAADHAPAASATTKSESKSESPKSGGSTVSRIWNNTRNFLRNTFAGGILATTVSATDTIENVTTAITGPTSRILTTMGNTADAMGKALQNTTTGNALHSMANTLTLPFRAAGSVVEGSVNALGGIFQYASAGSQVVGNRLQTAGKSILDTFSTSNESPDIPHRDIYIKDAPPLGRNGDHAVVGKNHTPSKSGFMRWADNVIKAPINAVTNVARVATDTASAVAQRVRGVVEGVEGVAKGIKKSRSGVFTKGQSFSKKLGNIFTQGIWGSAKSVVKGVGNVVNEGVLKTAAAAVGIATNLVGRTVGNVVAPLFSSKANHADNIFEKNGAFNKMTEYYKSTPRGKSVEAKSADTGGDHKADHTPKAEESAHPEAEKVAHEVAPATPAGTTKKEEKATHPDAAKGHGDHASPTTVTKKADDNHTPKATGTADPFTAKAFPPKAASHETPKADHPEDKKDDHTPETKKDHAPEAATEKKDKPHKPDDKGHDAPKAHKDDDNTGKGKPEAKEGEKAHDTHTPEAEKDKKPEAKKDDAHGTKSEKAGKTEAKHDNDDKHPEKEDKGEHDEAKAEPAAH